MYIKKTTGYVVGEQDEKLYPPHKISTHQPYRVTKAGHVLSVMNKRESKLIKSAGITSIANQGLVYYQVNSNGDACESCKEHHGAIYPVIEAKEGETLPPFHPNCKCMVQGFGTENPNRDPWLGETIFWLDIMYGDGTMLQKAQKVLNFCYWKEFSVEFISNVLSEIDDIEHIGKRMEAFFSRLDKVSQHTSVLITAEDLDEFGWYAATQDEAERLLTAFESFGITSRESMIQFIAIASAESGGGQYCLEGEWMSDENFIQYLQANNLGYSINERGAGYIQITWRTTHLDFLAYIGDDFDGEDTARYIAANYPLEASVWYWTIYGSPYSGGLGEFIETQIDNGGDPLLIFLKTAYYVGGMPLGNFNSDINDAISGKTAYAITHTHLIINGNQYALPSRWKDRLEAYEKAQNIW